MIVLSFSITIGCKNQNSLIEFAILLIWSSQWILLLNSYGINFSIWTSSIFILFGFFEIKRRTEVFSLATLFGWMFQDHRMFHAFSRQAVGLFWFIVLQWIKTNYQHKCFLFFKYSTHSEYILISSSSSGVDILYGFLSNIISSIFSIQYCWIIRRVYII